MRARFRCLLTSALLILIYFPTSAQVSYPNTLLWRISGKELKKPSYLFGTMHLKDARIFHFSDSLYHYLEQSEGYAMEIDPEMAIAALMKSMSEPDTSGLLYESISKEEFRKVAAGLEKKFKIPATQVTRKQAWLYKLSKGYGEKAKPDDMNTAVDTYLFNIARRQGKWVGGIEDIEDQFTVMEDLLNAEDFGNSRKSGLSAMEKLIQTYIAQDLNGINNWIAKMDPVYKERMLTKRNVKMSQRMDSLAQIRSQFFAVGAAHLPGEDGVIHLLKSLGYEVNPVLSAKRVDPAQYRYTAVELPWTEIKGDDESFIVHMPGKAFELSPIGENVKMKVHADMGSGLSYFAASMPVPGNKNRDSALMQMAKRYIKANKNANPVKVKMNHLEGLSLMTEEDGYTYELRLLLENNRLVMLMAGSEKKTQLSHPDVKRFFESLQIQKGSTAPDWYLHSDTVKAFSVSFPGKPVENNQINQQFGEVEGWAVSNLTFLDPLSQTYYMMVLKETKPGYGIVSDQDLFAESRNAFANNQEMELTDFYLDSLENKLPFSMASGNYKPTQFQLKSFTVNRGNRSYILTVVYDKKLVDTLQMNNYFKSFQLLDYQTSEWKIWSDSLKTFTVQAPSSFQSTVDSVSGTDFLTAYDSLSGFSYYIEKNTLSPYFWAQDDSTLYADAVKRLVGQSDSLLYKRNVIVNGSNGVEYLLRLGDEARNRRHGLLLLNGDTFYSVYTLMPVNGGQKNYMDFMNSFTVMQQKRSDAVFTNKSHTLFHDLGNGDSTTFVKAKEAFSYAPFTAKDLPYLHQALLRSFQDDDSLHYGIHQHIVEKVSALADTSTITFIAHHYDKVEKESLKYPLLNVLVNIKTKASYDLLKHLLMHNRPKANNPGALGYQLSDSLDLARPVVKDWLPLFSDAVVAKILVNPLNILLDSNKLALSEVTPFLSTLLSTGDKIFMENEGDGNYSYWNEYDWTYLISRFDTKTSNAQLQKWTKSIHPHVKFEAVKYLLKNKQAIDPATIQALAKDEYYRLDIYNELITQKKEALFPLNYKTQESIAKSMLHRYLIDEDYSAEQIVFLMKRQSLYKGKMTTFYLFRIGFNNDGEKLYRLGVVGPLPEKKVITTEAELIDISEENFDAKKISSQLAALLAQYE